MRELYSAIAVTNYRKYLEHRINNASLDRFFQGCFQDAIDHDRLYPAWVCMGCLRDGTQSYGWGRKPSKCPTCQQDALYEVGTFNARATVVGKAFTWAFYYLLTKACRIPLSPTPGATRTHHFEIGRSIAIEAKGSPASFKTPDGTTFRLDRPGLERSDTEKKAFANARTFKERNPTWSFYIVTNALRPALLGYRSSDVDGIFDVTQKDRLAALVHEIETRVPNLADLRRAEGWTT